MLPSSHLFSSSLSATSPSKIPASALDTSFRNPTSPTSYCCPTVLTGAISSQTESQGVAQRHGGICRLAICQAAVDCARKANNIKVWKQVHVACVGKKEFRLAQICGLNLIVDAEQLQTLVEEHKRNGYFDELISLLKQGLGPERAHMGMLTELGIAVAKYHPDRLMEHIKIFWSRMDMPKMIRAYEEAIL
ncbi:clathrin heavy chain [Ilyonectria robusta]